VDALVTIAQSHPATARVDIVSGDDDGPYTNVNIDSGNVSSLWPSLRDAIVSDAKLSSCVIACCEGNDGSDDYLLLYHYDKSEPIDALS